jgi:hypothetical protein
MVDQGGSFRYQHTLTQSDVSLVTDQPDCRPDPKPSLSRYSPNAEIP